MFIVFNKKNFFLNCRASGCFCDKKLNTCIIERKTKHAGGKEDFEYANCMKIEDWECAPPGANEGKHEGNEESPYGEGDKPNEENAPSEGENTQNEEPNEPVEENNESQ